MRRNYEDIDRGDEYDTRWRTLGNVDWKNAELKRDIDDDEILGSSSKRVTHFVGSPSLIGAFSRLGLIDVNQLGVQATVWGWAYSYLRTLRIELILSS